MHSSPRLDFWLEFASTYTYLSMMRIEALAQAAGVEVTWRPFILGPIFAAQGWSTSPFLVYPAKGRYMWRDVERRAAALGLPFAQPPGFPQRSLLAARVMLVGVEEGWGPAFARFAFEAQFANGCDIADAALLAQLVERAGGAADAIERAQSDAIKQRLRASTDEAQARGVFGAPSFTVGEELFWGDDRLEDALKWAVAARQT